MNLRTRPNQLARFATLKSFFPLDNDATASTFVDVIQDVVVTAPNLTQSTAHAIRKGATGFTITSGSQESGLHTGEALCWFCMDYVSGQHILGAGVGQGWGAILNTTAAGSAVLDDDQNIYAVTGSMVDANTEMAAVHIDPANNLATFYESDGTGLASVEAVDITGWTGIDLEFIDHGWV